ncbi:MAG: 30S ribosomal protein S4 [Candidatus Aenigmarchaeota archaeon]|nr:30S ribosomal protein S4 [Candidatus Aenigmarchaeota archaeon]MCX8190803.1 30S ribosomal protein S4 [Candidatus Aenigmarchaeota archaeon]MDW8160052.1 30S ribosomal protein S4 [Candidatus Aenigmarchaeota archaeon]
MKRFRKKYKKPRRLWDKALLEEERNLLKEFGLRRKKELWRAKEILRKYRRLAKKLNAIKDREQEKILLQKLNKMGLIGENSNLDSVLGLTVRDILNRRLQTIVYKKGLARTIKQARQLIVHGHVKIAGRKIVYPSYLVPKDEEDKIECDIKVEKNE